MTGRPSRAAESPRSGPTGHRGPWEQGCAREGRGPMLHGGHARVLPTVPGAVALLLAMGESHVYAAVDLLIDFFFF